MRLNELRIRNFRNFTNTTLNFAKLETVILGENGSGKTNLFRAIKLTLDKRYFYRPDDDDFSSVLKPKKGHWIIIQARFCDVFPMEQGVVATRLCPDEQGVAWITYIFRPGIEIREKLVKLSDQIKSGEKTKEDVDYFLDSLDFKSDYEVVRTVGKTVNFLIDNEYNAIVGNFDTYDFSDLIKANYTDKIGNKEENAIRYLNIISIFAGRNAYEELIGNNGLVKKIIEDKAKKIDIKSQNCIEKTINTLNSSINEFKEFQDLAKNIEDNYERAIGKMNAKKTSISSIIPPDFKDFIKYLSIRLDDDGEKFPISSRSLGEQNLLYLVLKIINEQSQETSKFVLILLEEPEVHLHTHLQRTLFKNIQSKFGNQMILSTHSPNISDAASISKMILLERTKNNREVFYPSKGLTPQDIIVTERYLDANRTPLLFARNVMLVEGDAEAIVVPWLFEQHYGATLDEYCVSLIKMDSTFFDPIAKMFHEQRIKRNCFIITDRDKDYTQVGSRNKAEKNGKEREDKLVAVEKDNPYIKVFFAENTFEIQLLLANISVLKGMVENKFVYVRAKEINEVLENLKSDQSSVLAETIMRCVEFVKKGWFALALIDYCNKNGLEMELPQYINDVFEKVVKCHENQKID
jgi:putative ATP-dependent endonuclease of OLD family